MLLEPDATGYVNLPILADVPSLDISLDGDGIGLRGLSLEQFEGGERMKIRIQMTNEAAMRALGLLLQYAEQAGLEVPSEQISQRPKAN